MVNRSQRCYHSSNRNHGFFKSQIENREFLTVSFPFIFNGLKSHQIETSSLKIRNPTSFKTLMVPDLSGIFIFHIKVSRLGFGTPVATERYQMLNIETIDR